MISTKFMCLINFTDERGMRQEVSLNVKKGIEAKSYEGVSIIDLLKNQ